MRNSTRWRDMFPFAWSTVIGRKQMSPAPVPISTRRGEWFPTPMHTTIAQTDKFATLVHPSTAEGLIPRPRALQNRGGGIGSSLLCTRGDREGTQSSPLKHQHGVER